MKIGILGGTYNPPHTGHLHAAQAAKEELGLDRLILLPSFIPPHKEMPQNTPDAAARLEMTRLAADEIGAEVSDLEIIRGGTSYTADTLAEFRKTYPDDTLWFIVGGFFISQIKLLYLRMMSNILGRKTASGA